MKGFCRSAWKFGLSLLILSPYMVGFVPNPVDSSMTTIELAAGWGSYAHVSRDCNGKVLGVAQVPFQDAGLSVDHYVSVFRFGAKTGILHVADNRDYQGYLYEKKYTAYYVQPNLGLNTKYLGVDVGPAIFDKPVSYGASKGANGAIGWGLRVGNRESWYLSCSSLNNLPLVSGGGAFDLGLGFGLGKKRSNLWIGFSGGPYERPVVSFKTEIPSKENLIISIRGQIGTGEGSEHGLSIGGKFIF